MPLESFETPLETEEERPSERPSLEFLLRRQHVTSLTRELDLSYAHDASPLALAAIFEAMPQLNKLVIRDVGLTTLPPNLGKLSGLRELDASDNRLTQLPESFGKLSRLQHANLSRNQLSSLPKEITALGRLRLLNVNYNALPSLPEELGRLPQLRVLRAGANTLESLPKTFSQLKELRLLQLAYNKISSIPEHLVALGRLRVLDIAHNSIHHLPDNLRLKTSLMSLNISGNPLDFTQRAPSFAQNMRVIGLPQTESTLAVDDVSLGMHAMPPPGTQSRQVRPDVTGIFLAGLDGPQTATGTFLLDSLDDEHTQPEMNQLLEDLESWENRSFDEAAPPAHKTSPNIKIFRSDH